MESGAQRGREDCRLSKLIFELAIPIEWWNRQSCVSHEKVDRKHPSSGCNWKVISFHFLYTLFSLARAVDRSWPTFHSHIISHCSPSSFYFLYISNSHIWIITSLKAQSCLSFLSSLAQVVGSHENEMFKTFSSVHDCLCVEAPLGFVSLFAEMTELCIDCLHLFVMPFVCPAIIHTMSESESSSRRQRAWNF